MDQPMTATILPSAVPPAHPAPNSNSNQPDTDTDTDNPPPLPHELIEAVLIQVPLLSPLSKIGQYPSKDLQKVHKQCAAVLNVSSCSRPFAKVIVPRLHDHLDLIVGHVDRFGAEFLQRLYERGFRFNVEDAWHVAMAYNRVDVLEWLVQAVTIPKSTEHAIAQDPVSAGLENGSWDALDWLAQADLKPICDKALSNAALVDLIQCGGERELQFVELWLRAGYQVDEYDESVLVAALEIGCLPVLDAWYQTHYDLCDVEDRLCSVAIQGQGPVVPILDWMLAQDWDLPNVAEYASEAGKLDVLEWWKENKDQIEQILEERHDHPDFFSYRMLDPEETEVEPDWLCRHKYDQKSCLELARSNDHQHVLDWWGENEELLPMPYSFRLVNEASGSGDLQFLRAWKVRWEELGRSDTYDCDRAVCAATKGGHIEVLEWWINESNLDFEPSEDLVLRAALEADQFQVMVDWWINQSNLEMCESTLSKVVNRCDNVELLNRWNQIGRPLPFNTSSALRHAANNCRIDVLDWWKHSAIPLANAFRPGATMLVDSASAKCAVRSLMWIRALCAERGYQFQYSEDALDDIFWDAPFSNGITGGCAQLKTVQWWVESGMELKYSASAFRNAIFCLSNSELRWWLNKKLPVNYSSKCAMVAVRRCGEEIISRLESFGLKIDFEDEYYDEYYLLKLLSG